MWNLKLRQVALECVQYPIFSHTNGWYGLLMYGQSVLYFVKLVFKKGVS